MSKVRLDQLLMDQGLAETRSRARAEIMAGNVLVEGEKILKAGTMFPEGTLPVLIKKDFPYVSRGALKLKEAFRVFPLQGKDKVCLDIGSSTGGFTEILLLEGARKVFAVDVGTNQLAWKLREDPRVVVMEKTNARFLEPASLGGEYVDLVVTDVSFISLKMILPAALACLKQEGEVMALVKPQFEAGRGEVGKKGVVTNPKVHRKVIDEVMAYATGELGFSVHGLAASPLLGQKGNREFLLYLNNDGRGDNLIAEEMLKAMLEPESKA